MEGSPVTGASSVQPVISSTAAVQAMDPSSVLPYFASQLHMFIDRTVF